MKAKKINIRTKGANGEREIASHLNDVIINTRKELELPKIHKNDLPFQRNQNQTAVGGDDLTNPFGLSIEVKRQENLSINTWWNQTLISANRSNGIPVLMFKQNRKKWRIMMFSTLQTAQAAPFNLSERFTPMLTVRSEIDIETFTKWFKAYYINWLVNNK